MKILFMMTEPRVMKYYHETLRFMLKNGHSVHVAYFSLEKYRKGRCTKSWRPSSLNDSVTRSYPESGPAYGVISVLPSPGPKTTYFFSGHFSAAPPGSGKEWKSGFLRSSSG